MLGSFSVRLLLTGETRERAAVNQKNGWAALRTHGSGYPLTPLYLKQHDKGHLTPQASMLGLRPQSKRSEQPRVGPLFWKEYLDSIKMVKICLIEPCRLVHRTRSTLPSLTHSGQILGSPRGSSARNTETRPRQTPTLLIASLFPPSKILPSPGISCATMAGWVQDQQSGNTTQRGRNVPPVFPPEHSPFVLVFHEPRRILSQFSARGSLRLVYRLPPRPAFISASRGGLENQEHTWSCVGTPSRSLPTTDRLGGVARARRATVMRSSAVTASILAQTSCIVRGGAELGSWGRKGAVRRSKGRKEDRRGGATRRMMHKRARPPQNLIPTLLNRGGVEGTRWWDSWNHNTGQKPISQLPAICGQNVRCRRVPCRRHIDIALHERSLVEP